MRVLCLAPVLVATALVAAVTLAACGSSTSAAGPQTRVIDVSPVTANGTAVSGYRTTSHAGGATCEPGSEAIGHAYRCFAGNYVYDPCWAERANTPTVLCVVDPWLRTDAKLTVGSPLAAIPSEGGIGEPWGVQLVSGQRCVLAQGAHSMFRGRVVDFVCGQRLALLRAVNKSGQPWTAASIVIGGSGAMRTGPTEKIAIAWYGSPDRFR